MLVRGHVRLLALGSHAVALKRDQAAGPDKEGPGGLNPFMLVRGHVHLFALEPHALGFEPEALLKRSVALKRDPAAGPDHAMPRYQPVN